LINNLKTIINYNKLKKLHQQLQALKAYEYYMVECEAAFFADQMQLTHFVFDKILTNKDIQQDVW
jgi:lipase chaperone LimK